MSRNDAAKTMVLNKGYTPAGFAKKIHHRHVKPTDDRGELYFRDYLQVHSDIARRYESLKLQLTLQYEHDRDVYTNAKAVLSRRTRKKHEMNWASVISLLCILDANPLPCQPPHPGKRSTIRKSSGAFPFLHRAADCRLANIPGAWYDTACRFPLNRYTAAVSPRHRLQRKHCQSPPTPDGRRIRHGPQNPMAPPNTVKL